jgi:hypothetical protein
MAKRVSNLYQIKSQNLHRTGWTCQILVESFHELISLADVLEQILECPVIVACLRIKNEINYLEGSFSQSPSLSSILGFAHPRLPLRSAQLGQAELLQLFCQSFEKIAIL